jgi:hypothetical protein
VAILYERDYSSIYLLRAVQKGLDGENCKYSLKFDEAIV